MLLREIFQIRNLKGYISLRDCSFELREITVQKVEGFDCST